MIKIDLHELKFHSFHGIHDYERKLGNTFIVDASVEFHENTHVITELHETIDYTILYDMVEKRMQQPTPLLETVVMNIAGDIAEQYQQIKSINISLKKLNPPIEGMEGSVGVRYHKEY